MTISVASLVPPNPSAGLPLTIWIGKHDIDDYDDDDNDGLDAWTAVVKGRSNREGRKG